jgi:hypothetical protein
VLKAHVRNNLIRLQVPPILAHPQVQAQVTRIVVELMGVIVTLAHQVDYRNIRLSTIRAFGNLGRDHHQKEGIGCGTGRMQFLLFRLMKSEHFFYN